MRKLLDVFWTFFKIGLFTFGGGYVMIGIIEEKVVLHKKWITEEEMIELLSVSESTPGPFSINVSTFVGYKRAKILGSIAATLGTVLPSIIIITLVSIFLEAFKSNPLINNFLKGISAGVGVLVFLAFYRIGKKIKFSVFNLILFIIGIVVSFFNLFSVVYALLGVALIGIIKGIIIDKEEDENNAS